MEKEIKEFRFTLAKMYHLPQVEEMMKFIGENLKEGTELAYFGSIFKEFTVKFTKEVKNK